MSSFCPSVVMPSAWIPSGFEKNMYDRCRSLKVSSITATKSSEKTDSRRAILARSREGLETRHTNTT